MAYNIASRFRHEYLFTGNLGQDIYEYSVNYLNECSYYDQNTSQKLRLFYNQCDGEVNRFFKKYV